jgi:hypothetical protein
LRAYWDSYWFGPIAAVRPFLFVRGMLLLLAFDLWLDMPDHAARYDVAGFNVSQLAILDLVYPIPTAGLYVAVVLLAGLCAFSGVFAGFTRPIAIATGVLYTFGWTMSMFDSYQHHYLLSIVLIGCALLPSTTALEVFGSPLDEPAPRVVKGKAEVRPWQERLETRAGVGLGATVVMCWLAFNLERSGWLIAAIGLDGIRGENVEMKARLEASGHVVFRIYAATGDLVRPFPFRGRLEHLTGTIDTDRTAGVDLFARGRVERVGGPTDHVRAQLRVNADDAEALQFFDLRVSGDPVDVRILPELGFEWAELLHGSGLARFRLYGYPPDLDLAVWAETDAGNARVEGTIREGRVAISGHTRSLALDRLVRNAPAIVVAGDATVEIEGEGARPRFTIAGQPFTFEGLELPSFELSGYTEEDRFVFERLTAPYARGELTVDGFARFDGTVDVHVTGNVPELARDPNTQRFARGLRGGANVDLRVATFDDGRVLLDGDMVFRRFRYGPVTADLLQLSGRAEGFLEAPVVDMTATTRGLAISGYEIGDGSADVRGDGRRYSGSGSFETGSSRALSFDATAEQRGGTWTAVVPDLAYRLAGRQWNGRVDRIEVRPSRSLDIGGASLARASESVRANVHIAFTGADRVEVQLGDFDLTTLAALDDALPELRGRFDGRFSLEGDFERPDVEVEGSVRDGGYAELHDVQMFFTAGYVDGTVDVTAQAELGQHGDLTLSVAGLADPGAPDLISALRDAVYSDSHFYATELDLTVFRHLFGEAMPELGGHVTGQVTLDGVLAVPNVWATFRIPDFTAPEWPTLAMNGVVSYESGSLVARVSSADELGELGEIEASLLVDLVQLIENPDIGLESLETLPWRVSVRIPARVLGTMPDPIRLALPDELGPLSMAISGTASGGSAEPRADFFVSGDWTASVEGLFCGQTLRPRFEAIVELRDGTTTARGTLYAGNTRLVSATASAPTPVTEWLLAADIDEIPPLELHARIENAESSRLPYVCDVAQGPLSASLDVTGLFTDEPAARLVLAPNEVSVMSSPPGRGRIEVIAQNGMIRGNGRLGWWPGELATVSGSLGLRWDRDHVVPELVGDAPVDVLVEFQQTPIGPIVAWLPPIEAADGFLTGRVRATGTLDDIEFREGFSIENGYVEVAGTGQHLSEIEGRVQLRGRWARLVAITAHDGDGTARFDGDVELEGFMPSRMQLTTRAEDFPIRMEGSALATLSGVAALSAEITDERTSFEIDVQSLEVQLPEDSSRSTQALETHPDIVIVGREEREEEAPTDAYPIEFRLQTMQPFRVVRSDMEARVGASLTAVYRDPDFRVSGLLTVRGGWYEVFDRRFQIDEGALAFDGRVEFDPSIRFVVSHRIRGSGTTVTVYVSGRLSEPIIDFTSDDPDCNDRASIIAMLVTGRCGSRTNAADARTFDQETADLLGTIALSGLPLLVDVGEASRYLPRVAVQEGRTIIGTPPLDFSFLIPGFLEPYVLSILCSGTVGAQQEGDETLPAGFRCEVNFAENVVLEGGANLGGAWGADLTWEP